MPAPDRIKQLVETFEQNIHEYQSHKNETELRRQFLDPFFEALGWDVDNKKGYDERNKEVAHEHSVEIDGQQKKADYAFRTPLENAGQAGKDSFDFLVEAKKPSVKIESSLDAAFQVRRYGWSAGLPINILTDFEHFAVYDCRTRPNYSKDKAATGRINIIHYQEYVERWDEIAGLFSPEAIRKGALEKYKDDLKGKKGTQEVDDAFLEEIEQWRETLARNIATRNKHLNLNEEQVNFAVQMTIDRIIFLRIAEERGMEKDHRLFELVETPSVLRTSPPNSNPAKASGAGERNLEENENSIYKNLLGLFQQADQRYNSGLFHFKKDKDRENPDTLTPSLDIDDKVLKDIVKDLYYPSPYAFNYIPTEILGSVYERFLGKVIRLTAGGNAKVEDKPEVRKAGGVYYTPAYIVDYIVKNTVGQIVNLTSTPDDISKLKIVDPACGSGSFLLGAYQFLLDWHLSWYTSNNPEKYLKNKTLLTADSKTYRLSIDEKKRILLNNIHGVDLDPQAVEVTKLSLLLKVVEDPGQLKMFEEGHILPNLNQNIKNGNALIGTDYFSGQMFGDMDEMKRVKPFDWKHEFPEVFRRGGFDVVVGNPPYVRQETLGEFKDYLQKNYKTFHGTADLYVYFIERGITLLRANGLFSYIVANKWFRTNYAEPLRKWLKQQSIEEIVDFGDLPVFQDATTYPCIIRVSSNTAKQTFLATKVDSLDFEDLSKYLSAKFYSVSQDKLEDKNWSLTNEDTQKLLSRLKTHTDSLEKYLSGEVYYGIKTGLNEAFVIDENTKNKLVATDKASEELIKPFLIGRDIKRYSNPKGDAYLILIPRGWTREKSKNARDAWGWLGKNYPAIASHLAPFADAAAKRYDKGEYWWELRACDYYDEFEKPKIVYPNICKQPEFTLELTKSYTNQKCFIIPVDDKYLLGILNSKLCFFLFKNTLPKLRGDFYEPSYVYFKDFPIRAINFNDPAEKSLHEQMVKLVEQMLSLHKSVARAGIPPNEKELLERQIKSTDGKIDELVYQLYGLSEEEIKIVEG